MWFVEFHFLSEAKKSLEIIKDVKDILLNFWDEAKKLEVQRLTNLKELYDEIIGHSSKTNPPTEDFKKIIAGMVTTDVNQIVSRLYSFRALISEDELKCMMMLNST